MQTSKLLNNSFTSNTPGLNVFNYNPILDYLKDQTGFNNLLASKRYSIGGGGGGGTDLGDIELFVYILFWIITMCFMIYIIVITIMEGITTSYWDVFVALLILLIFEIILTVIINKKLKRKLF